MTDVERRKARIERKFNSLNRAVQSLDAYLKEESPDAINAELRLNTITSTYNEYVHDHEELALIQNDHPNIIAFNRIESEYFKLAATVQKLRALLPNPLANSTSLYNTLTFTERADVPKLAPVSVPKFDGKQENWVAWKASFQALIHERPGMAGTVKLSQLKDAVHGLAEAVISEFCLNPSENSYLLAWEGLCKAYDQRRVIINEHFDALLNLSPSTSPTSETTAKLMYTVRQHHSMLKAMKIRVCDELVVRMLERCLPAGILARWIERLSSNKSPSLNDLYAFIQNSVFKQREMDKLPQRGHPSKRAGSNNVPPPSKVARTPARSLVTTSASGSNACPQCGQSHNLYKCDEFNKSKIKDRWDLVRSKKLCRNCLYAHPLPCSSEKRCKKCQKDHHTLLHADKKSQTSNGKNSQPTKEATSSGPSQK